MNIKELGRRAVACKHWRWMPGMRWEAVDECGRLDDYQPEYMAHPIDAVPDLSDPATLGCLLALVRQAYADPAFCIQCVAGYWYEDSDKRELVPRSNETEAEALVAALEAAP